MEASVWAQTPATAPPAGRACCVKSVSVPTKHTHVHNVFPLLSTSCGCLSKHTCVWLADSSLQEEIRSLCWFIRLYLQEFQYLLTFCLFVLFLSSLWTEVSVWQPMCSAERLRLQERILRFCLLQKGKKGWAWRVTLNQSEVSIQTVSTLMTFNHKFKRTIPVWPQITDELWIFQLFLFFFFASGSEIHTGGSDNLHMKKTGNMWKGFQSQELTAYTWCMDTWRRTEQSCAKNSKNVDEQSAKAELAISSVQTCCNSVLWCIQGMSQKSQSIITVTLIHCLKNMNICTKFCPNSSSKCSLNLKHGLGNVWKSSYL